MSWSLIWFMWVLWSCFSCSSSCHGDNFISACSWLSCFSVSLKNCSISSGSIMLSSRSCLGDEGGSWCVIFCLRVGSCWDSLETLIFLGDSCASASDALRFLFRALSEETLMWVFWCETSLSFLAVLYGQRWHLNFLSPWIICWCLRRSFDE